MTASLLPLGRYPPGTHKLFAPASFPDGTLNLCSGESWRSIRSNLLSFKDLGGKPREFSNTTASPFARSSRLSTNLVLLLHKTRPYSSVAPGGLRVLGSEK